MKKNTLKRFMASAMTAVMCVSSLGTLAVNAAPADPAALPHGQYLSGQRPGSRCQRRSNRPQAAGAAAAKAHRPRPQAGRP